jgi:hypothetical protein
MRCSVSASLRCVSCQSASSSWTRSSAAPVREHPGRVGQRGEQGAQDPQRRLLAATLEDLAADRAFEPGQPEPAGAGQVAAVTAADHGHRRRPRRRPERVPSGVQRRRPHALQQGADLLHLGDHVDDQLLAAHAEVPQPTPGLVDRLRDVAAQLPGQPGDQHRVLVVGLVEGQVLAAPRPRGLQGLHTHERHPPVGGQLAEHPPPVPGRLARHRHPSKAFGGGPTGGPVQRLAEIPGPALERAPCQHPRVVVAHDDHLLLVGQVDPDDRVLEWNQLA